MLNLSLRQTHLLARWAMPLNSRFWAGRTLRPKTATGRPPTGRRSRPRTAMLRVAVGRLSTPHGATWSPAPRTHVGQDLTVTSVRLRAVQSIEFHDVPA